MTFHSKPSLRSAEDTATEVKLRLHHLCLPNQKLESSGHLPDLTESILKQIKLEAYPELQKTFTLPRLYDEKYANVIPSIFQSESPSGIFKFLHSVCQKYVESFKSSSS